jgi:hypothetical protein
MRATNKSKSAASKARKRSAGRINIVPVVAEGVLDMVDFRPKRRKCHITRTTGVPLMCTFYETLDDDIYDLLRKPVTITGEAKLHPTGDRIEPVHIRRITELRSHAATYNSGDRTAASLSFDSGDFFANHTIEDLAKQQKIKPMNDLSVLSGGIPEDIDLDEFLGDIYASRK